MYVCWRGGWISIPETRGARPGWGPEVSPAPPSSPTRCPGSYSQCGCLPPALTPATPMAAIPMAEYVSLPLSHPYPLPTPISLCLPATQYYEMSYGLNIEMHKQVCGPPLPQPQTGGPSPLAMLQV